LTVKALNKWRCLISAKTVVDVKHCGRKSAKIQRNTATSNGCYESSNTDVEPDAEFEGTPGKIGIHVDHPPQVTSHPAIALSK